MKAFFKAVVLGLFVCAVSSGAAGAFEGSVVYKFTMSDKPDQPMTMTYWMKGQNMRMDTENKGHKMSVIIDLVNKKELILMHDQKMVMTQDYSKTAAAQSQAKSNDNGSLTDTGNSDTLAGRTCEEWEYVGKNGKADIWLAKNLGFFPGMVQGNSLSKEGWITMAKDKDLFPLKFVTHSSNGKTVTMLATSVSKETVDDSKFQAPAGYKTFQMPDIGSAMGQGAQNSVPKLPF